MAKPDYDTTVARMAANIASGYISDPACAFPMDSSMRRKLSEMFVEMAREIVAEVKRTELSAALEGAATKGGEL